MTGFNFDQDRMSLNETKMVTDCSTNNNKKIVTLVRQPSMRLEGWYEICASDMKETQFFQNEIKLYKIIRLLSYR